MDAWTGINVTDMKWTSTNPLDDYKERASYDANGNILSYTMGSFPLF